MKYLKNITNKEVNISDLIKVKDKQVISMALTNVKNTDIRLFSLSKEEIFNEKYEMDTIYLCLEGNIIIDEYNIHHILNKNDMIAISSDIKSHIIAQDDSIMFQIMVKE